MALVLVFTLVLGAGTVGTAVGAVRPDPRIREYQTLLKQAGYYTGPLDGIRGPATQKAVLKFQKESGLTVDGIVGPVTLAALKKVTSTYVVRKGDTLGGIAARFGVSADWLARQNKLKNPNMIHPGQELVVGAGAKQPTVSPGKPTAASKPATGSKGDTPVASPGTASRNGGSSGTPGPSTPPGGDVGEKQWETFVPGTVPVVPAEAGLAGARVALTFDDGPDATNTPLLLDVLKKHKVPATFFLVGERVRAATQVAQRITAEGHEIGNHSFAHRPFTGRALADIEKDLSATQGIIQATTGQVPRHFRPPGGVVDETVSLAVARTKLRTVFWNNVGATDDLPLTADELATRIASRCRDGTVIMLHGDRPLAAEVTERLIGLLGAAGVQWVKLSELCR